MHSASSESLKRLFDRAAIHDALYRWCRAIDRQDYELLGQVFHADAVIDNGSYNCSVAEYAPKAFRRHASIPRAAHMIGNVLIDFTAPNSAFSEAYCHALEHQPGSNGAPDLDRIVRMRYADQFEEREGAWKIARRLAVIDHEIWQPATGDTAAAAGRVVGTRDESDPVWQLRRSLGL